MSAGLKRKVKNKVNTFDKTKKLTQVKIPLDEKIEIFEKFLNTGNTIKGNTIFEGYPIGQWAIQIRSAIKKQSKNERTNRTSYIKITEEQLNKLNTLGILDRQIEATLDEKIDMLIQWMAKYPKANMRTYIPKDILKSYASTEEEYLSLTTQYQNMQRYYTYIRVTNNNGRLTKRQFSKCKEGNVRGVFGYPTSIEQLSKKTGKNKKYIDHIINCYGSMENFINLYRNNELDKKDFNLARSIIKNVIDIDLNPNSNNYDKLYYQILGSPQDNKLRLYSSKKLQAQIEHLTEKEKLVIEKRFGISPDNSPKTLKTIGDEIGLTVDRIRQIEQQTIRKLRIINRNKQKTCSYNFNQSDMLTHEENKMLNTLEKKLYSSSFIFRNNPHISPNNATNRSILKTFELIKKVDEITEEQKELKEVKIQKKVNTPLEDANIPIKAYIYLQKIGMTLVGDLRGLSPQHHFYLLKELGKQAYIDFLREVTIYDEDFSNIELMEDMTEDQMKEMIKERKSVILDTHIDDLEFSARTYNALKREGLCTLGDISNVTEQKLAKIRNLGEKSCNEVIEKLKEYGLSLKENENDAFIDEVLNQATIRINIRKQDEQAKELAKDYEKIDKNGRLK